MADPPPGWWLEETDFAGPEHLDASYVDGYEHKAGYDPTLDVESFLRHGLTSSDVVVDLGCGPGVFARAAATRAGTVLALDVSPAMRAAAATAAPPNVEVLDGGFLSLPHDRGPVDIVFSRNVLHQLPDLWKHIALDQVARILRPGGLFLIHDLAFDADPGYLPPVIDAWMAGAVDDPATGYTAGEFAEHLRTEFSTTTLDPRGDPGPGRVRHRRARLQPARLRDLPVPAPAMTTLELAAPAKVRWTAQWKALLRRPRLHVRVDEGYSVPMEGSMNSLVTS